MGSNKSKKSRSSSSYRNSPGAFSSSDMFGSSGSSLVPIVAIVCGVLIGMGGAYLVKKVFFGANKKRPEIAMVEEAERPSNRGRLKKEARVRPAETAPEAQEPLAAVEEPIAAVAPVPEPVAPAPLPTEAKPAVRNESESSIRAAEREREREREREKARKREEKVAAARKEPIRVATPVQKPAPVIAMAPEPAAPEPLVEEPKLVIPPKAVTIKNLTYSKALFNRCPEDCLLLFRAADGGAVKAKLKKSSFQRVLSNNLAFADLEGFESVVDGERVIVVKSVRGTPVPTPAPKIEPVKPAKEEKVAETPKAEKGKKDKNPELVPRKKDDSSGDPDSDQMSLRSRLEGVSKGKKKEENSKVEEDSEDSDEGESSSFQNRLKKSLD